MGTPNIANWGPPQPLAGDPASEAPGLCGWDDHVVYALFRKGNDTMRWGRLDVRTRQWTSQPAVGKSQSRPALGRVGDELLGFYRSGSNDDLWTSRWRTPDAAAASAVAGGPAGDPVVAKKAQLLFNQAMLTPWTERRLDFDTKGPPAVVGLPGGGLLLLLVTTHGLAATRLERGGYSLPQAIPGIALHDDRVNPALAVLGGSVHLVASVVNHRSTGERALELFAPVVGTAVTSSVEKLLPHWRLEGATWSAQQTGFTALAAPQPVGLATLGPRLHLVLRGNDGALSWYFTQDGRWSHGGQLGKADGEPALAVAGDQLVMFWATDGHLSYRTYHDDAPPRLDVRGPVRPMPGRP